MQTANHPAALAGYYLAPAPSPTPTSLSAQFHYALASWTPGGLGVLVAILAAFVVLMLLVRRSGSSQRR
jgi:hypothetical protein